MEAGLTSETEPLLANSPQNCTDTIATDSGPTHAKNHGRLRISLVLPLSFTAAFSIAATSATSVYAYAILTCKDPAHCKGNEKAQYAGVLALATTIANLCGTLIVPVLRQWTESNSRLGISFWLMCRASGIALLLAAVRLRRIEVALVGRVLEGFASDNVLHYGLNAVYIRAESQSQVSRLMGISLALYMSAMSMAPTAVTFLPSFIWSFFVAIALLGSSFIYLLIFVPRLSVDHGASQRAPSNLPWYQRAKLLPVLTCFQKPAPALLGFAILCYNSAQAYLFPTIMVHAALKFGFTNVENGYIVSIAAFTSAVYLFIVLLVLPRTMRLLKRQKQNAQTNVSASEGRDAEATKGYHYKMDPIYALVAMSTQLIVLPCFTLVNGAPFMFVLVVLISLGLAAPSFIKSYAISRARSKETTLADMAFMESVGGLLSPIILGTVQSLARQGSAFLVAAALVGMATLSLLCSMTIPDLSPS